jgi:hypothetical protein
MLRTYTYTYCLYRRHPKRAYDPWLSVAAILHIYIVMMRTWLLGGFASPEKFSY